MGAFHPERQFCTLAKLIEGYRDLKVAQNDQRGSTFGFSFGDSPACPDVVAFELDVNQIVCTANVQAI